MFPASFDEKYLFKYCSELCAASQFSLAEPQYLATLKWIITLLQRENRYTEEQFSFLLIFLRNALLSIAGKLSNDGIINGLFHILFSYLDNKHEHNVEIKNEMKFISDIFSTLAEVFFSFLFFSYSFFLLSFFFLSFFLLSFSFPFHSSSFY